jgi:hypothetical protein
MSQHSENGPSKLHTLKVHIDREPYESPNHTTGEALYKLGTIGHGFELFQEVDGDREDVLIKRNDEPITLRNNEHFYSEKEVQIVVNAKPRMVAKRRMRFEEVVELAFPNAPKNPNTTYTVAYRHGPHANPEGTLTPGNYVKIRKGMVFSVTATDKS